MAFSLVVCGSKTAEPAVAPAAEPAVEAPAYKVSMITDYGDITDQSFKQTTYEACREFCTGASIEFTYFKPTTNDDAGRIVMIESAIDRGFNVIVMPGYAFGPAIVETAEPNSDVTFVAPYTGEGNLGQGSRWHGYRDHCHRAGEHPLIHRKFSEGRRSAAGVISLLLFVRGVRRHKPLIRFFKLPSFRSNLILFLRLQRSGVPYLRVHILFATWKEAGRGF